jgi:hypothetical protein
MKHLIGTMLVVCGVGLTGAAAAAASSATWVPAVDARPEAILTGMTLLMAASLLRRSLSPKESR